jgi:hypothetical protein
MAPVIQHRRRLKDRYRQQAGSYRLRVFPTLELRRWMTERYRKNHLFSANNTLCRSRLAGDGARSFNTEGA